MEKNRTKLEGLSHFVNCYLRNLHWHLYLILLWVPFRICAVDLVGVYQQQILLFAVPTGFTSKERNAHLIQHKEACTAS